MTPADPRVERLMLLADTYAGNAYARVTGTQEHVARANLRTALSEALGDSQPVAPKIAPVQGWPMGIPWELHLEAYAAYSKKWAPQPAMIEGGCRGGFSTGELDDFIPGWRDRALGITALHEEIARLRAELASSQRAEPASVQAPIPKGVYYLLDSDNFYDTDGTGMTHEFYRQWQPRCMEFPSSRIAAALAAHPSDQNHSG